MLNISPSDGKVPKKLQPKHLPIRPMEVIDAWCTVDKAERVLGYKTTVALEEGVSRMVEWAKTMGPQKFHYLEDLEIVNEHTPETWKNRLI